MNASSAPSTGVLFGELIVAGFLVGQEVRRCGMIYGAFLHANSALVLCGLYWQPLLGN